MGKMDSLKRRAVTWHLALSLLLSIVLAAWLLLHWFPAPFSFAAGALTGLVIVVSVDMCLGPMLTLLLIHSKKSLRENIVDGIVVATLQVSALGYGLWQVSLARPAAVVFWQDSFYLVKAFDYQERYGKQPDLSKLSSEPVPVIYARYPLLLSELEELERAIKAGVVPYEHTPLYRKVADGLLEIRKSPVDINILITKHADLQSQLDALGTKEQQQHFIFSRLHSDYGVFILVLEGTGKLVGLLKLPA